MCVLVLAALLAVAAAAARPECPAAEDCRFVGETTGDFVYELDGGNSSVSVNWRDGAYVELVCRGTAAALDARAAPRFQPGLEFPRARVACPPGDAAVGSTLARLGVLAVRRLTLAPGGGGGGGALRRAHLAALPGLQELRVEAPHDYNVTMEDDALADLHDLQVLTLVRMPAPDSASVLPAGLRTLVLQQARGSVSAPRAWAGLRRLRVEGAPDVTIHVHMNELRELWVSDAPLSLSARALSGALLENVTIQFARALPPDLFTGGAGGAGAGAGVRRLRQLAVLGGAVTSLAENWLANMSTLQVVRLSRLPLASLPAGLLRGAGSLTSLAVTRARLTALPAELLRDATNLIDLDLSYNSIEAIPESLLSSCARLAAVDVSHNRLTSLEWAGALPPPAAAALASLSAGDNPLGDVCPRGVSALARLGGLRALRLRNASVPRVCRDWRLQLTRLRVLDLERNNLTDLDESALHWVRLGGVSARALLSHNPLSAFYYSEDEWRLARDATRDSDSQRVAPAGSMELVLSSVPLACDCRVYWLLQAPPPAPRLTGLCERERGQLDELSCESEPCPPECSCRYKPSEPDVTHMSCSSVSPQLLAWPEPASLRLLPRARAAAAPRLRRGRRLLLAGNEITTLTPEDLPDYLQEIDVSNNSISLLSEAAVTSLFSNSRRVRLAHNPLTCACAAEPLLAALHRHKEQVLDYSLVWCADGRAAGSVAARSVCAGQRGLRAGLAAGAALLLAGAAGAALLARYRHLVKAALHARGWWPAGAEDDAHEYEYDAFVSYSHLDGEWVERVLVARLEAGGARRLCVHARDWLAGEWIAAQMERSVGASRRTLAVLSPRYLGAAWPRAELRLALAASLRARRPRLVVVLLERVPDELLDDVPQLRAYLAANTYLRADDPAFWHKLACALPPARSAQPAPPAAPAAA